jgi:hypothetical protein
MNVIAIDRGLNGAGTVPDERGNFITCFDLPTIVESAARRRPPGAAASSTFRLGGVRATA